MEIIQVTNILSRLGESPFWHEKAIYWTDILNKKIYRHFPQENKTEERAFSSYIGAFAPRKNGGFVLATKDGFSFLSDFNGTITPIINPEDDKENNRFNDGKCDSLGRFWAGTMDIGAKSNQGSLYMLGTDCRFYKKYFPVTISNGICWSLDDKQMYYIDTPTQQVLAFDFNLETGEIKNPRPLITIDKSNGSPDGMTLDTNGCLWVALWGGGSVICCDPKRNLIMDRIKLPVSQVSSCAFGGENLDELYITSAFDGLRRKEKLAGALFKVKTGTRGSPTNLFGG